MLSELIERMWSKPEFTDQELDLLIGFFENLSETVSKMPREYNLFKSDIYRRLTAAKNYKTMRQV